MIWIMLIKFQKRSCNLIVFDYKMAVYLNCKFSFVFDLKSGKAMYLNFIWPSWICIWFQNVCLNPTLVAGADEGVLRPPDESGEAGVRTRVSTDRPHPEVGVVRTARERTGRGHHAGRWRSVLWHVIYVKCQCSDVSSLTVVIYVKCQCSDVSSLTIVIYVKCM